MDSDAGRLTETLVEQLDKVVDLEFEPLCESHEPGEVRLPRLLALAELLRRLREEPLPDGELANHLGCGPVPAPQQLQQLPGRVAREQGRPLERDASLVERLLEL